ncbi:MAG: hypothetical protein M1840_001188 [Geoglossum simile]|nr:MAG: hypothetical protein M1840_001188 [Geoglossum simile]
MKVHLGWYDDVINDDADSDWGDDTEETDERMDVVHRINKLIKGFMAVDISPREYKNLETTLKAYQILQVMISLFDSMRILWIESCISM